MVDKVDFSKDYPEPWNCCFIPKDRTCDYDSSFESDAEVKEKRKRFENLFPVKRSPEKVANKRQLEDEYEKEEGRIHRFHAVALDAYSRHKQFINTYMLHRGTKFKDFQRDTSKDKTDIDVIRENHQFLWDEDDNSDASWEKRLAKKYYDKLFKEYCIADLSRYKENKVGMRWRIEKEVVDGKGQFICGNKKCSEKEGLRSWEVNFGYAEHGQKKNALVKLRLCPDCSYKLNYHHKRKEILPKPKRSSRVTSSMKEADVPKRQKLSGDLSSASGSGIRVEDKKKNLHDGSEETGEKNSVESEGGDIWSQPTKLIEEKSREDEFDDYFAGMFL